MSAPVLISDEHLALAQLDEGHVLVAKNPLPFRVCDLAAELARARAQLRKDSRLAGQVKKFRWIVENMLTKVERLEDEIEDASGIEEAVALWLEGYGDEPVTAALAAQGIREGKWRP